MLSAAGAVDLILKSQILAGGRGKGTFNTGFKGGVKVCSTPAEVNTDMISEVDKASVFIRIHTTIHINYEC